MAELAARQAAERQRARRRSQFRAAPPPRFPQPSAPVKSERPATRAVTPRLAVKTRSAARAAFDAAAAKNRRMEEVSVPAAHAVLQQSVTQCHSLQSVAESKRLSWRQTAPKRDVSVLPFLCWSHIVFSPIKVCCCM